MNNFDELLTELDVLAKAQSCDDKGGAAKIKKAAEDGAAAGGDAGEGGEGEGGEDDQFGKAFEVTLEDGTKTQAFDGTAMLKALHDENAALHATVTDQGEQLQKALEFGAGLLGQLKVQGELIKSLQADVVKLGNSGTGRRAMVNMHEKPATTGAQQQQPTKPARGDVMAKALSLLSAGSITGSDVARIEANFDRFGTIPADYQALFTA